MFEHNRGPFVIVRSSDYRQRGRIPLYTCCANQQVAGQYFEHLHEVVASLTDLGKLQAAGFIDRAAAGEGDIIEEDHLASVLGSFVVVLLGSRLQRSMWLIAAWPMKMGSLLHTGVDHQGVVDEFRQDYETFCALCALEQKPRSLDALLQRSTFRMVATRQWVAACKELQ